MKTNTNPDLVHIVQAHLAAGTHLELCGEGSYPVRRVALGLAGAEAGQLRKKIYESRTPVSKDPIRWDRREPPPALVFLYDDTLPQEIVLRTRDASFLMTFLWPEGGAVSLGRRELVFPRAQRSVCKVEAGAQTFVYDFNPSEDKGQFHIHVCVALGDWTPPGPPRLPTTRDLMGDASCADWLRRAVEQGLASPSLREQIAAVGLLGRLWYPGTHAEKRAVHETRDHGLLPPARVRRWAASLSREEALLVERLAVAFVDEHALPSLARFEQLVAIDPAPASDAVLRWLHVRDDLASIEHVLAHAPADGIDEPGRPAAELRDALGRLDRRARECRWALAFTSDPARDERLRAVSLREPWAWWGDLTRDDSPTEHTAG